MPDTLVENKALKGGEFLIKDESFESTFIPEEITEEQQMVRDMVRDFLNTEIIPNIERIEKQEEGLSASLLEKMAELGLLGSHMPEVYGGMQMDTNTNTLICDIFGPAGAFTVSYAAHTGIGMLPILYFGT
jgi:alkylation response protein AidB-like acyl-CoA dehydrogenase